MASVLNGFVRDAMDSTDSTLHEWISKGAIAFSSQFVETLHAAVDRVVKALADNVQLVGLGEPMHGDESFLSLRNLFFQRLVKAHGFGAIAIESSFPRAHIVNEYVAGLGPATYDEIRNAGFSHGFGGSAANRELVEWMRAYNADPRNSLKLRFYGFDSPTEMMMTDSPRGLIAFVLNYLATIDPDQSDEFRQRMEPLLGDDAPWENTEAAFDATKSIGLSPAANALRIEAEELLSELHVRRPELAWKSGEDAFLEAEHYASLARQLLMYHAAVARQSDRRVVRLLGLRDAMMADNLAYIAARERPRGRVLAFAHNMHLQRGIARWQWGPGLMEWWPAGAHLDSTMGASYSVIGSAVGICDAQGINPPEEGTIEAMLMSAPGPARFVPTNRGRGLPTAEIASIPTRSGSMKNSTYFPLTPQSLADFDWLLL